MESHRANCTEEVVWPDVPHSDALAASADLEKGSPAPLAAGPITTVANFDAFAGEFPESIAMDRFGKAALLYSIARGFL